MLFSGQRTATLVNARSLLRRDDKKYTLRMKQRIAIDMDDVMADTHAKFIRLYLEGEMPRYTLEELREKSFHELFDEDEYRVISQRVHEPGFLPRHSGHGRCAGRGGRFDDTL